MILPLKVTLKFLLWITDVMMVQSITTLHNTSPLIPTKNKTEESPFVFIFCQGEGRAWEQGHNTSHLQILFHMEGNGKGQKPWQGTKAMLDIASNFCLYITIV